MITLIGMLTLQLPEKRMRLLWMTATNRLLLPTPLHLPDLNPVPPMQSSITAFLKCW